MSNIADGRFHDTQSQPSLMCFGDDVKDKERIPKTKKQMKEGTNPTDDDYLICGEKIGRFKQRLEYGLEHHPKTPSGWNGPHLLNCLDGNVKGVDGKAIKFQDFEQAIVAANENEDCGGITLKYSNGKSSLGYYLSSSSYLKTTEKAPAYTYTSQIMCWIKE